MTDAQIMDLVAQARDEGVAYGLAMLEFFRDKKHSTGAVRSMAPYITQGEAATVTTLYVEVLKKLRSERKTAQAHISESGGILLPPSGLLLPPSGRV